MRTRLDPRMVTLIRASSSSSHDMHPFEIDIDIPLLSLSAVSRSATAIFWQKSKCAMESKLIAIMYGP